jgi:hypothetical protein
MWLSARKSQVLKKADCMEVVLVRLDAGAVDFHLNDVAIDVVHSSAERLVEQCGRSDSIQVGAGCRVLPWAHECVLPGASTRRGCEAGGGL